MNKWKKYTLFSVTCWSLVFQLNWSIYETGSLACPYNLPAGGRCYFTTQPPNDYFQTYHCPVFLSAVSCHWLLISSWEIIHQSAHRASFLYILLSDAHKALISLSNKRSRDWKPVAFLFSFFFPAHLFIFTCGVPGCDFQKRNFTARDDSVDPCCFDWSQLIRSNWDGFSLLTKPICLDTSICAVISHFVDDFISHAIEPPTRTTK